MKKLAFFTIVLLIIGMCFMGCSANTSNSRKPYDSLNMERDELKKIKKNFLDNSDDTAVYFFWGTNLYRFEHGESMKEIWKKPEFRGGVYGHTIVSKSGEVTKIYFNDKYDESLSDGFDKLFSYAVNTSKVFDKKIKVKNVYCFAEVVNIKDAENMLECAIPFVYYVTNKGDFVLCRFENNVKYLFPLDKFKEYIHAIYVEDGVEQRYLSDKKYCEEKWEAGEMLHGAPVTYHFEHLVPSPEAFDLTPYIFEEIT